MLERHGLPPTLLGRDVPAIGEPRLIGNGQRHARQRERPMSSPWDGSDREVTVLRGEEHSIIGMHVCPPDATGRFAIEFRTDGNRILRVALPADQLQALADVLQLPASVCDDDARESRELIT
jgi:hypothetical protein